MDQPESSLASRKAELIRDLDRCRRAMELGADEVASALNFSGQFRASFASSSWQWLIASLAAGLLSGVVWSSLAKGSTAFSSPEKSSAGMRFAKMLLRGAFESFGKPALQSLLQGKGEKWLWRLLDKSGS